MNEGIGPEFLAQGPAINSKNTRSLALVAVGEIHDGLEQWPLYLADYEIVQIAGTIAVQSGKILVECVFGVLTKRLLVGFYPGVFLLVLFLCHFGCSPRNTASSVSAVRKRCQRAPPDAENLQRRTGFRNTRSDVCGPLERRWFPHKTGADHSSGRA